MVTILHNPTGIASLAVDVLKDTAVLIGCAGLHKISVYTYTSFNTVYREMFALVIFSPILPLAIG